MTVLKIEVTDNADPLRVGCPNSKAHAIDIIDAANMEPQRLGRHPGHFGSARDFELLSVEVGKNCKGTITR